MTLELCSVVIVDRPLCASHSMNVRFIFGLLDTEQNISSAQPNRFLLPPSILFHFTSQHGSCGLLDFSDRNSFQLAASDTRIRESFVYVQLNMNCGHRILVRIYVIGYESIQLIVYDCYIEIGYLPNKGWGRWATDGCTTTTTHIPVNNK